MLGVAVRGGSATPSQRATIGSVDALEQHRRHHDDEHHVEHEVGVLDPFDERERGKDDRHGSAQTDPRHECDVARVGDRITASTSATASGLARTISPSATTSADPAISSTSEGNTSRPSTRNIVICISHARPSANRPMLRWCTRSGVAEHEPREVHGEEPAPVEERRRHRTRRARLRSTEPGRALRTGAAGG